MELEFIEANDPRFNRFVTEYFALLREKVWLTEHPTSRKVYNFIFI